MKPLFRQACAAVYLGDAARVLAKLPAESANCCVTSPPYWGLRDYGHPGQLGQESTPQQYVANLVAILEQVRRVLRSDGTLWLNLGDTYAGSWKNQGRKQQRGTQRPINGPMLQSFAGHPAPSSQAGKVPHGLKPKDLVGIPWRVAFALQSTGWWLRQDIIWHKPNPMPESVRDRCTKAHEYLFLLSRSGRYYYDRAAIAQRAKHAGKQLGFGKRKKRRAPAMGRKPSGNERPGANARTPQYRNRRSVWVVKPGKYPGPHFATFPPQLIEPCILAGCPPGGTVLDPFLGSGTTAEVAAKHGRQCVGVELNREYAELARQRLRALA